MDATVDAAVSKISGTASPLMTAISAENDEGTTAATKVVFFAFRDLSRLSGVEFDSVGGIGVVRV